MGRSLTINLFRILVMIITNLLLNYILKSEGLPIYIHLIVGIFSIWFGKLLYFILYGIVVKEIIIYDETRDDDIIFSLKFQYWLSPEHTITGLLKKDEKVNITQEDLTEILHNTLSKKFIKQFLKNDYNSRIKSIQRDYSIFKNNHKKIEVKFIHI